MFDQAHCWVSNIRLHHLINVSVRPVYRVGALLGVTKIKKSGRETTPQTITGKTPFGVHCLFFLDQFGADDPGGSNGTSREVQSGHLGALLVLFR